MGRKVIGRAFPISAKAAKSYDRARPRAFKRNPLGVTALARVNGRGAYSARAASAGLSRSARLARARKLAKGASMKQNARAKRARFVSLKKNPAQKKRSGKRLAAYNAARRRGLSGSSAARSALRKVPFTANERRSKTRFGGVKARMRRNRDSVGEQKKYEEGWDRIYGKKADEKAKPKRARGASKKGKKSVATKTRTKGKKRKAAKGKRKAKRTTKRWPKQHAKVRATRRVKTTKRVPVTRKARVAYGPYRRARLFNPRTGRKEYSYYYRTKKGTYRRIPAWAVGGAKSPSGYKKSGFKTGGGPKQWARTKAARERAAARLLKEGGVFTPNKRRAKAKRKGSRKRSAYWAAYRRARAAGATKTEAKRLARGEKKMARRGRKKTTKRRKAGKRTAKRRTTKRRTTKRRTKRAGAKRRGTRLTKRQKAARKAARTRKRNAAARSRAAKKGARRRGGKKRTRKTSARKRGGKRRMRKNRGMRRNRRMRGNRRGSYRRNKRRYRRNQGFAKTAMEILKVGALVTVGFLGHRLLTSLAAEHLLGALTKPAEGEAASESQLMLAKWSKPLAGVVVAGVGVALASKIKNEKARTALGAGMIASVLQSTAVTLLMTVEQPKIAAQFEGYSNSMAYQLRGNRRRRARQMRGLGAQTSIMPRYQAISGAPFQQAAAGTGEYFQANSVGEYFAPTSTQGVGAYEAAGPLAMQAAAGTGQVIEDGIRPDDDLDRVLDLAESAAGLGAAKRRRGMGEYYSAQPNNGGYVENRVPTQSQWIPNGPLWAGTLGVKDTIEQSELPAGILAGPGGNGVLSGG